MSVLNLSKDKVQKEAFKSWLNVNCIGTIEAATAFGKTRTALLALEYVLSLNPNGKVLIVVPTTAVMEEWYKEITKWKMTKYLKNCDIQCINTARTYDNNTYDLGVFDEIHNYILGDVNNLIFKNNKFDKILGLSASLSAILQWSLASIAPVCYVLTLYDALELGLVSNFKLYNLWVELSPEERKVYDARCASIAYVKENFGRNSWRDIRKRKDIIYNAKAKYEIVSKISNIFKDDYGIVFSLTKYDSDSYNELLGDISVPHHSGISLTNRRLNLKKFADGRTKIKRICSAKTLDEGVTIPRLRFGVITSNFSSMKQMVQRIGRTIRPEYENKMAIIIRLCVKNTVDEKWMLKSQKNLNVINLNSLDELEQICNDDRN